MKRKIFLAVATFTLAACHSREPVKQSQPVAVRTVPAQLSRSSDEVRYSGVVTPDAQVDMAFRVPGYIEEITRTRGGVEIQEGDFVAAGAVLATLRSTEYEARLKYAQAISADASASLGVLRAQLRETDASLRQVTKDFDRAKTLLTERAVSQADFDAIEAKRSATVARREALESQIVGQQSRLAGSEAQQREAQLNVTDTVLTAPFPAVVVAKKIARGSLVSAGVPAFVLADMRTVRISFGVPDVALKGFKRGDEIDVAAEAIPDRRFRGRITEIGAAADPTSRSFTVEIALANPQYLLRAGMIATLVVGGTRESLTAPAIPLAAVVKSPSGFGVYRVENDRVRLQPVTLGPVRGNAVLITAGLTEGQRVVATGGLQLTDGEAVKEIP